MDNSRRFVGLKDVILVTLLTAICILICTVLVIPFAANLLLVLWLVSLLDALLCGPAYMLAMSKAPRIGAHFLFAFLFAVYYFFTNGMFLISGIILGGGLIGELILVGDGYKRIGRLIASYAIYGVSVMMAPVVMLLSSKAAMIETLLSAGTSQEYIDSLFAVYSTPNILIGIALSVVGAVLGCLLGRKLLKKHFMPAGVLTKG